MKVVSIGLLLASSIMGAQVPQSRHVWIVTEENHSYESVIGNSDMPYFNSLATKYALATQYYSEQHNSISALMWLVAGQPVTGNNQTTSCYNLDNVARHLISQGYRWRSYQEDLPYAGFAGLSNLYYVRRHNPIIDFTDTCTSNQAINSVPFTQMANDITNHATPNYAYITPSLIHDAHNGTLAAADYWLSLQIPAILHLPEFQPGGDGVLFIVWDEADLSSNGTTQDNRCTSTVANGCGGRLATLIIGPQVKPAYRSSVRYDHANLLRTVCDAMGFSSCPGAGAVANPMTDFFNTVSIATPFPNARVASPVHVQASTSNSSPVDAMQVYVDNALKHQISGNSVNTQLPMSLGSHYVVVQSWDTAGGIHKRGNYINVQPETVVVTNPTPSATVAPSVEVSATAGGQYAISKMQLYVDGNWKYQSSGNSLNTSIPLTNGSHTLAVEATEISGNLVTDKFSVTAASPEVHILLPAANASLYPPMYISATAIDPTPVVAVQVYEDDKLAYQVSGTGVQATLPISLGAHSLVVQELNKSGATYKESIAVNVIPVPITISSPSANATVISPLTISAYAPTNSTVQTMQIYIDNALAGQASGQSISKPFTLSSGKHYIVAKGWDSYGNNWFTGEYINAQ